MMLISLFVLTCIAIISMAIGRQIWSKRNAKIRSLMGIAGTTFFIDLIKLTQQHRGMHSGFLNGKLEFEAKLPILENSINDLYSRLLSFEKNHHYPSSLSIHYPLKKWQRIIQNNSITSAESFKQHSSLIARQLDAIWDMSDEFSLTSNRNPNIRNSTQQLVKTLPELAEALGQIRALSVQVAARQEMGADKKLQLLFTLGKIEEHHNKLTSPLPSLTDQRLTSFVQDIKQAVTDSTLYQRNPDSLFQESTQVINDLFVFILDGMEDLKKAINQ